MIQVEAIIMYICIKYTLHNLEDLPLIHIPHFIYKYLVFFSVYSLSASPLCNVN